MRRRRNSSGVILADRNLVASDLDLRTDAVTATGFLSEPSDSLFVRTRSSSASRRALGGVSGSAAPVLGVDFELAPDTEVGSLLFPL